MLFFLESFPYFSKSASIMKKKKINFVNQICYVLFFVMCDVGLYACLEMLFLMCSSCSFICPMSVALSVSALSELSS